MLHFEKNHSNKIGIKLRPKNLLRRKELFFGFFVALLLHLGANFLFTIQKSAPPALIKADRIITFTDKSLFQVDLHPQSEEKSIIAAPPSLAIPYNLHENLLSEIPLDLAFKPIKGKSSFATLKGTTSRLIDIPDNLKNSVEEPLTLTLRSDESGNLFWLDWIEKSQNFELNRSIEEWVKRLKFKKEEAFNFQKIEIQLYP